MHIVSVERWVENFLHVFQGHVIDKFKYVKAKTLKHSFYVGSQFNFGIHLHQHGLCSQVLSSTSCIFSVRFGFFQESFT